MDTNEMKEMMPTLTLDPDTDTDVTLPSVESVTAAVVSEPAFDKDKFTEAELAQIDQFSNQINLYDMDQIMKYGTSAQKKSAAFSDAALNSVKTKEFGEIGDLLVQITTEIRGFGETEKKGLAGLFQRGRNKVF